MNIGYLSFVPIESLVDKNFKVPRHERRPIVFDYLEGTEPPVSNWNWSPVVSALKRGPLFVVEARSPTQKVFLRFDPSRPEDGVYELNLAAPPSLETGSTQKVTAIQEDEQDFRFEKIMMCRVKFVVLTMTSAHPKRRRACIVGLNECREITEEA